MNESDKLINGKEHLYETNDNNDRRELYGYNIEEKLMKLT